MALIWEHWISSSKPYSMIIWFARHWLSIRSIRSPSAWLSLAVLPSSNSTHLNSNTCRAVRLDFSSMIVKRSTREWKTHQPTHRRRSDLQSRCILSRGMCLCTWWQYSFPNCIIFHDRTVFLLFLIKCLRLKILRWTRASRPERQDGVTSCFVSYDEPACSACSELSAKSREDTVNTQRTERSSF